MFDPKFKTDGMKLNLSNFIKLDRFQKQIPTSKILPKTLRFRFNLETNILEIRKTIRKISNFDKRESNFLNLFGLLLCDTMSPLYSSFPNLSECVDFDKSKK